MHGMNAPKASQRTKARQNTPANAQIAPNEGATSTDTGWQVKAQGVSLLRPARKPKPVWLQARPQKLEIDLQRSALVVVDMQNDFCHTEGWFGQKGVSMRATRKPIPMLQKLLPLWRADGGRVVWLNWGVRADRLNLPAGVLFAGINTDRCVFSSLQDAGFLGYDCVLLEDACSTPSPAYVSRAILFLVEKLHGFVASAQALTVSLTPKGARS